jgi:hypothetical protein
MKTLLHAALVSQHKGSLLKTFIAQIIILLSLGACSGIPISYYDATTYTQLTSLKAETTTLVERALTPNHS